MTLITTTLIPYSSFWLHLFYSIIFTFSIWITCTYELICATYELIKICVMYLWSEIIWWNVWKHPYTIQLFLTIMVTSAFIFVHTRDMIFKNKLLIRVYAPLTYLDVIRFVQIPWKNRFHEMNEKCCGNFIYTYIIEMPAKH